MQVLLTERASDAAAVAARALADAGHMVRYCHDEHDPVRCGVRRHVPVASAGSSPGATVAGVTAAASEPLRAHSIAATDVFRRSLATAGPADDATVNVRRRDGYLRVTIEAPVVVPEAVAQRAAVRMCQVLREMDSTARGIDVASPVLVGRDR